MMMRISKEELRFGATSLVIMTLATRTLLIKLLIIMSVILMTLILTLIIMTSIITTLIIMTLHNGTHHKKHLQKQRNNKFLCIFFAEKYTNFFSQFHDNM